jgi:hypothetical protein
MLSQHRTIRSPRNGQAQKVRASPEQDVRPGPNRRCLLGVLFRLRAYRRNSRTRYTQSSKRSRNRHYYNRLLSHQPLRPQHAHMSGDMTAVPWTLCPVMSQMAQIETNAPTFGRTFAQLHQGRHNLTQMCVGARSIDRGPCPARLQNSWPAFIASKAPCSDFGRLPAMALTCWTASPA